MIVSLKNLKNIKKRTNQKMNVPKDPPGQCFEEAGKSKSS